VLLVACAAPAPEPTQALLPTRAASVPATAAQPRVAAIDYYALGAARQQAGDLEAALRNLTWAIQTDPGLAVAYLSRSAVYLALGDLSKALGDAEVAHELEPSAQSLVLQGESLRQMERHRQASEAFEQALEYDASLAGELFGLRWSAARASSDVARIRALSEEYAKANPDESLRYYYLGWAALESGVPNRAIGVLVEGIGSGSRPPALLWYVLGVAYTAREAWPEAVSALETTRALVEGGDTSLGLHTDQPIGLLFVALGEAYLGAGRCADAVTMLEFAKSVGASGSEHRPLLEEAQICLTPTPIESP
jgi:tetratricopeptide (TPR) repeat protein